MQRDLFCPCKQYFKMAGEGVDICAACPLKGGKK